MMKIRNQNKVDLYIHTSFTIFVLDKWSDARVVEEARLETAHKLLSINKLSDFKYKNRVKKTILKMFITSFSIS